MTIASRLGANINAVAGQFRRRRRGPPPRAGRTRRWLGAATIVLVAIAVVGLGLDAAAAVWAYDLPWPVVHAAAILSSIGRSVWFLIVTGVVALLFFLGDWRRVPRLVCLAWWEIGALAGYAFVAFASAGILVNILKPIFGRARPRFYLDLGPFAFDPISFGYSAASFPSGHSTDMGVFIVVAGLMVPALRVVFLAIGILFASSRVVVLAHYPSDVVAGLVLGGIVAYGVARLYARSGYAFRLTSDGHLRPRTAALRRVRRRREGRLLITAGLAPALFGRDTSGSSAFLKAPEAGPAPPRDPP